MTPPGAMKEEAEMSEIGKVVGEMRAEVRRRRASVVGGRQLGAISETIRGAVADELERWADRIEAAMQAGGGEDMASDATVWTLIDLAKRSGATVDEGEEGTFFTLDVPAMYALESKLRYRGVDAGWANYYDTQAPTPPASCGGGLTREFVGADFSSSPSRLEVSFAAPVGDPIAYLHHAAHADGEPDQVLSFSPDAFPFDKIVTGTSVEPLFNAAQMAAAIEHAATCALRRLSPVQAAGGDEVSEPLWCCAKGADEGCLVCAACEAASGLLLGLVSKWRDEADRLDKSFGPGNMVIAADRRQCASELEAALSAAPAGRGK